MPLRAQAADPFSAVPALSASPRLLALARKGLLKRYPRGRLVIEEGEIGDSLFIILQGRLRAFSASAQSGRQITYGRYGPGEYVGELGLDGGPRTANVEAEVLSLCSMVTRQTLDTYIAQEPAFAFDLLAKVIRRARAATLSARQLALNDVYGRLSALLQRWALPQADGMRAIPALPSHLQMSRELGCSREMVSRLMKDLQRGGHLELDGGRCVLLRELPARW